MTKPNVGQRLRLRHNVERFPHFRAPAGALGTVVSVETGERGQIYSVDVKLDETLKGAEPWDNCIVWDVAAGDDFAGDCEEVR